MLVLPHMYNLAQGFLYLNYMIYFMQFGFSFALQYILTFKQSVYCDGFGLFICARGPSHKLNANLTPKNSSCFFSTCSYIIIFKMLIMSIHNCQNTFDGK